MKTKLIILVLLVLSPLARATLIDLTPGGFSEINNPPPIFFEVLNTPQLAGANISGSQVIWSPFEPFGPSNFSIQTDGIDAVVGWNLINTAGFRMVYVLVEGTNYQANIYKARFVDQQEGTSPVTIDNLSSIDAIIFFGSNNVPDSGYALILFDLGLLSLLILRGRTKFVRS